MKRKARVAILGVMLQGSAHAAVHAAPAEPSLQQAPEKAAVAQQPAVLAKKGKGARSKKASPAPQPAETEKPDASKQDGAMANPAEPDERGVRLRGVRG